MSAGQKVLWPNGGLSTPIYYREIPSGFRWTSGFGMRTHPVTGAPETFHYGLDLIGWSTIVAPVTGVVTFAGYNGGAGNEVRIREDGTGDIFRLLHNRELWVKTGARVVQGQGVAVMGTTGSSTGIHCHEETRPGGGAAIDPLVYYAARNNSPAGGGGEPFDPKRFLEDAMTNPLVNVIQNYGLPPANGTVFVGLDDGTFEALQPPYHNNIRGILSVTFLGGTSGTTDIIPTLSVDDFNAVKRVWAQMKKGRTDAAAVVSFLVQAQDAEGRPLFVGADGKPTTTPTATPLRFDLGGYIASTNALAHELADSAGA